MKLLEYKEHEATNDLQRIGCLLSIIVSLIAWALIIFLVITIWHYITPFSETKKVRQVVAIEETPRLVINTETQYLDIPLSHEYQDYVVSELKNYPYVTKELAYAVMERESHFDFNAVGQAKEQGIFQIHPINFGWLKEQGIDVHDPKQNIKAGLLMLNYFIGKQSDIEMGLICYNTGESKVNSLFEQGIFSTKYSREVVKRAEEMERF